jgi:two-component system chemotaxis response regulator CheY
MSDINEEKILIVDDAMFMRYTIKKALGEGGYYNFIEASDVLEAVDKYKQEKPDLVTMDITMPGKSGLDGLKEIMQLDPAAKVVMVSAAGQKPKVIEALKNGAKHFIVKPFKEEDIVKIVNTVLGKV